MFDYTNYAELLEKRKARRQELSNFSIWNFESDSEQVEKEKALIKLNREREIIALIEEEKQAMQDEKVKLELDKEKKTIYILLIGRKN